MDGTTGSVSSQEWRRAICHSIDRIANLRASPAAVSGNVANRSRLRAMCAPSRASIPANAFQLHASTSAENIMRRPAVSMPPRTGFIRHSSELLFRRVGQLLAALAAAFAFGHPDVAQAFWLPLSCPVWDLILGSPENAFDILANADPNVASNCKPIVPIQCEPNLVIGPARFNCTGIYNDSSFCSWSGLSYTREVYGSGVPVPENVIFTADFNSKSYCAVQVDDTNNPKNKGNPNADEHCDTCAKEKNLQGNPVNIAAPNKFQRERDFAGPKGDDLLFERSYNSVLPAAEEKIGSGWTHNWSRSLLFYTDDNSIQNALAFRQDGRAFTFLNSGSLWQPDADVSYQLVSLGANGWQLTTPNDETEIYSTEGRLASIKTRSGRVTTFAYSDSTGTGPNGSVFEGSTTPIPIGYLIRATDDTGRTVEFHYDSHYRIARIVDPAGANYLYTYDASGNLTGVQYPNGATRTYQYNESAYTSGADLRNALTGITDEKGARYATYKYMTDRRPLSTEHAGGAYRYQFTYGSGSTTFVDPLGTSRTATYTTILGVKQVTDMSRTCATCGGTTSDAFTFDANRNPTSYKDFNGNLTCYTYDSLRNLQATRTEGLSGTGTCAARVPTAATRTITTEWHPTWRVTKRLAEPLKITTYSYHGEAGVSCAPVDAPTTLLCSKSVQATTDADGMLAFAATADGPARTWSYTYNSKGRILTIDGPRNDVADVTTYAYYASDDSSGNYRANDLATITNAQGQVIQFAQYDGAGRVKKIVDANGLESLLDYWPRGWLKSRKVGTATGGYETTSYDYDNIGQLTNVTAPDGSVVAYTYDDAHRLIRISDGLSNRIEYTLDSMGNRIAENAYDPGNVLVRAHSREMDGLSRLFKDIGGTNPASQITRNNFDANGNVTSSLDPLGRTTTQEFDSLDQLLAVKDPFNGPSAPTSYQYNRQGMLTQVTDPRGLATTYTLNGRGEMLAQASPDTGTTTFTYDEASNVATKLDARGVQASYVYDSLNRVTQINYPDETVTYVYDSCTNGVGRLCSFTDRSGATSYTYDLWGRVTAKSQTSGTLTQTMGYAYNSAGQLWKVTSPSGRIVEYSYSNNRPVSVKVDGTVVLDSAVYEPFGPVGGWRWGNSTPSAGNYHTRVFDKDFRSYRITSDLPTVAGGALAFDRQIGWDAASNVSSITDFGSASLSAAYSYDTLNRLTSATQGSSSWGYGYDAIGNRATSSVNGAATTYAYAPGTNHLTSLSGAQPKSFVFDAAGNVTSSGGAAWTFGGNNRPTQVTSGATTTFAINALGQRVRKATGANAVRFVYDETGQLWGEYDDTGHVISETVWLGDIPVAVVR